MENSPIGAGMGTSGLVGPLAAYTTMIEPGVASGPIITKIIFLYFIAPAAISLVIHLVMKKFGLVKKGDMKV